MNGAGAMESSLRFRGDSKSLRIHAKEKIFLASNILFQAHGMLDTATGSPGYLALVVRQFYPELSASIGVGVNFNKDDKLNYHIRAKKALPLMENHNLYVNVKGRFDIDKELKKKRPRGGVELSWSILNFQKNQDVRVKVGYDICDKVPYFQIKENNWTFNADITGKWSVRFDL